MSYLIKLRVVCTILAALLTLALSGVYAGEVAPQYAAQVAEIEAVVLQLEEELYGAANEHEGTIYTFINQQGDAQDIKLAPHVLWEEIAKFDPGPQWESVSQEEERDDAAKDLPMKKAVLAKLNHQMLNQNSKLHKISRQVMEEAIKNNNGPLLINGVPSSDEIAKLLAQENAAKEEWEKYLVEYNQFKKNLNQLCDEVSLWQSLEFSPIAVSPRMEGILDESSSQEDSVLREEFNQLITQLNTYRYQDDASLAEDLAAENQAFEEYLADRHQMALRLVSLAQKIMARDAQLNSDLELKVKALRSSLDKYFGPDVRAPQKAVAVSKSKVSRQELREHIWRDATQILAQYKKILTDPKLGLSPTQSLAMQNLFWPLKEGSLDIYNGTEEENLPYNAFNDGLEQKIAITQEMLESFPEVTIYSTLAHEFGHSLSLESYVGNQFSLSPGLMNPAEAEAEKNRELFSSEKYLLDKWLDHQKHYAASTVNNYPFFDVLAQYAQMGVQGLDYFDPRTHDTLDQQLKDIFQIWLDHGGHIKVQEEQRQVWIPAELINPEKMYLNLYTSNDFSSVFGFVKDKLPTDLGAAYDATQGFLCRAEEVMADHFAKLLLETELQKISDNAERRKYVVEYLLDFFVYLTPATVEKFGARFSKIVPPEYRDFLQRKNAPPQNGEMAIVAVENSDDHPPLAERLVIFLSSPVIRQALQD